MITSYQPSVASVKVRFVLGLIVLISLVHYSALKQQEFVSYEYAVLFSITLAALIFDYLKLGQFLTIIEKQKANHCSLDDSIQEALKATLKSPLLFKLVGTELLTMYYAFFAKAERQGFVSENVLFSYTKSSNAHDVFLAVALSQLPLLPFIHLFVEHQKGPTAAWLITVLTLWSVIWYLAQVEAVKFRPVELSRDHLSYRFGLFWKADIPLEQIRMARTIDVVESLAGGDLFLSPLGSKRNVLLEFENPVQFTGPYLLRRRKGKAAISLDEPSRFLDQLAARGIVIG